MAIHHDKKAYGKLESLSEDFSEDKLLNMVQQLEKEDKKETADEKISKKDKNE